MFVLVPNGGLIEGFRLIPNCFNHDVQNEACCNICYQLSFGKLPNFLDAIIYKLFIAHKSA